jgi:hypothetical protein
MAKSRIRLPDFHIKQLLAFESKSTAQLYGGSTRGGKTAFVKLALIRWCSRIPNLQCDIFRLNYDDVIANYMDGEFSFPVLLNRWEQDKLVTITKTEVRFWNGALISLEHCSSDNAMSKHQGIDKHVRVFDEATQIPERRMKWLMGWVTMSDDMLAKVPEEWKGQFPKTIFTTNPIGPSAGFFRRKFVLARPKESIEELDGFKYQYIPAKVEDNPSVNAEATRARISGTMDAQIADALLNENWDALVGDFIREYNDDVHCIPDFIPPNYWLKWRSFDWGKAEPFSVLWLTISDGEPFKDHAMRERWYPRSSVIVYRQWHGCDPENPAVGIGLTNLDICRGIISRTQENTSGITVTDNLPFQRRDDELMADYYAKQGVPLTLGHTDRIMGWARIKDHLKGIDGIPMLYICESCVHLRDHLPALQRHEVKPEDAVESGETTHDCDALRVGLSTRPFIPKDTTIKLPSEIKADNITFDQAFKRHQRTRNGGRIRY